MHFSVIWATLVAVHVDSDSCHGTRSSVRQKHKSHRGWTSHFFLPTYDLLKLALNWQTTCVYISLNSSYCFFCPSYEYSTHFFFPRYILLIEPLPIQLTEFESSPLWIVIHTNKSKEAEMSVQAMWQHLWGKRLAAAEIVARFHTFEFVLLMLDCWKNVAELLPLRFKFCTPDLPHPEKTWLKILDVRLSQQYNKIHSVSPRSPKSANLKNRSWNKCHSFLFILIA